jgi:para-nitrobenzyl esterase
MSEDCLYLNVFSPAGNATDLPVMVFIHGGAFIGGSGGDVLYASSWGSALAKTENVVLVTINYRLGCFGFMRLEGADLNCGLHDQIAALRWVQREIHNFGGSEVSVDQFLTGR